MAVQDIDIENTVISARKGLVCQEADGIRFKNVTLLSEDTNPVLEVQNSRNLTFDNLHYRPGAELLLRITGNRSKAVVLRNTDPKSAKKDVEFGPKVSKKTVSVSKR